MNHFGKVTRKLEGEELPIPTFSLLYGEVRRGESG